MTPTAQYWLAVGVWGAVGALVCVLARRCSTPVATRLGFGIGAVLGLDAVVFELHPLVAGTWTLRASLPLDLCDLVLVIAAVTCVHPDWQLGVELTWFWGMTGTLQAVVTPDLGARFPSVTFLAFVVGHTTIVIAACYLVLGLRRRPRAGSVRRVFALTVGYVGLVGLVDALTGADYMYLARPPRHASLLSVLGPWPWYLLSAAAVALASFLVLDSPFRHHRVR